MRIGARPFVVGVQRREFDHVQARQREQNWCWAACVESVFRYHGEPVSQEEAVRHIFGAEVNRPGSGDDILAALRDWRSERHTVQALPAAGPRDVYDELAAERPLIVGLNANVPGATGHAFVLTAATGHYDEVTGEPVLDTMILRDPYPGMPPRVEMSEAEFRDRCTFITRVGVE